MLIARLGVWGLGVLQDLERQTLLERSPLYEQLDRDRVMLGWRQLQCCRPHFRMPRPTYMNSATASHCDDDDKRKSDSHHLSFWVLHDHLYLQVFSSMRLRVEPAPHQEALPPSEPLLLSRFPASRSTHGLCLLSWLWCD